MNAPAEFSIDALRAAYDELRRGFEAERFPTLAVRRDRLRRVEAMLEKHEHRLVEAMNEDFGSRSRHESSMFDILLSVSETRSCRRHLRAWMAPRKIKTRLHLMPARSRIIPQPLGVVGVMTPWNFPVYLAAGGIANAFAAGNRALLKPSELTPRTNAVLAEGVSAYFARDELALVQGGVDIAQAFCELPFDHIIFTGSTAVGRKVAEAAARNLTPVTLELGGKSPAIVAESARFDQAARSIAHARLANAGQVCIAADYALVPRQRIDAFAEALGDSVRALYPTWIDNPDYTAIVSDSHFQRLQEIVEDAERRGARVLRPHGKPEAGTNTRKFPPTILLDVPGEARAMREEIFGPILPVVAFDGLDDAIARVNAGERPLALYVFARDSAERDRVLAGTISGGVVVNDCLWHVPNDNLPFGGVGASGMGAYHGKTGFDAMSKLKPVMYQPRLRATSLLHPPYGGLAEFMGKVLRRVM